MKRYAIRVLIGLDQFINTVTGGFPNETISARSWRKGRMEGSRPWQLVQSTTDVIFSPFHSNHCEDSYTYSRTSMKTCGRYIPTPCNICNTTPSIIIDLPDSHAD